MLYNTHRTTKLWGVYWFHSVRPSRIPCPLCSACSSGFVVVIWSLLNITATSQCARRRLKSPTSPLFARPFVQTQIEENTKARRHWPLWGEDNRWPVDSLHKGPLTREMFPFDDVSMMNLCVFLLIYILQHCFIGMCNVWFENVFAIRPHTQRQYIPWNMH